MTNENKDAVRAAFDAWFNDPARKTHVHNEPSAYSGYRAAHAAQSEALASQALRVGQLTTALIDARSELEAWSIEDSGECYNNPKMNAIIDGSQLAAASSPVQAQPTDMSHHLRHIAAVTPEGGMSQLSTKTVLAAADEIERYYGGMLAWKKTAEAKDAEFAAIAAARPSAAEGWISVDAEQKPSGHTPILVAVWFVVYGEHEDGTPGEREGVDVTEGEFVPAHGERAAYFASYQGTHGDASHVTHWMPLPPAPDRSAS